VVYKFCCGDRKRSPNQISACRKTVKACLKRSLQTMDTLCLTFHPSVYKLYMRAIPMWEYTTPEKYITGGSKPPFTGGF
jgi:hypothetical protein